MAKFNKRRTPRSPTSPMRVDRPAVTHEGGPGYALDPKSELYTLAVTNFVGEDTFYEKSEVRDNRYVALVRRQAVEDPQWLLEMLTWLRSEGNMRTAALVGAAEAAHERITAGLSQPELADTNTRGFVRSVVAAVLQRPDEPGEFLAYWKMRFGSEGSRKALKVPISVRRGIADALRRMAGERSLAKYDTRSRLFRWGDIIALTHPRPLEAQQAALFRHALDRRHRRRVEVPEALPILDRRGKLMRLPVEQRRSVLASRGGSERLAAAGVTWEALAGWLQGPLDAQAWQAALPLMRYMARLRNLRNLDKTGVPDSVALKIGAWLADPEEVARSRQMPYRFLSAYLNVPSDRWRHPLNVALDHATRNIPALEGRTLVLVDLSGSMNVPMSKRRRVGSVSVPTRAHVAALFGVALAAKGEAVDVYGFATDYFRHTFPEGMSVLRETDKILARLGEVGYGTEMAKAVRGTYQGHRRVVIISDQQAFPTDTNEDPFGFRASRVEGITATVPAGVPVYSFDLGGYGTTVINAGAPNRHQLGGLTDDTFRLITLLEQGANAGWPWELKNDD